GGTSPRGAAGHRDRRGAGTLALCLSSDRPRLVARGRRRRHARADAADHREGPRDGDRVGDARPLPGPRLRSQFSHPPSADRRAGRGLCRRDRGAAVTASSNREQLREIAFRAMRERGLDPDFPPDALAQVASVHEPPETTEEPFRDLRTLLWCSIDNDDSRDLDQLSVAGSQSNGDVKVLVAIADVDAAVAKNSPVDRHAAQNTRSVYPPAVIFPMLPEKLSTDLTSLADQQDRLSVVVEMLVSQGGEIRSSDVYGARVRNRAKLAYNSVGARLAGDGPLPAPAAPAAGAGEPMR